MLTQLRVLFQHSSLLIHFICGIIAFLIFELSLAALLAGLAFSNVGVALVHALEYPVGGATHCSHGCGNGLLLPYVMRYNRSVRENSRPGTGTALTSAAIVWNSRALRLR